MNASYSIRNLNFFSFLKLLIFLLLVMNRCYKVFRCKGYSPNRNDCKELRWFCSLPFIKWDHLTMAKYCGYFFDPWDFTHYNSR